MIVIAGITRSLPNVFAGKQAGARTRDLSLSQERGDPARRSKEHSKGLAYVPVPMIVGPLKEGELIAFDDDLVLWLTKPLGGGTIRHNEAALADR
jgi:hypothetical protein